MVAKYRGNRDERLTMNDEGLTIIRRKRYESRNYFGNGVQGEAGESGVLCEEREDVREAAEGGRDEAEGTD